MNVYLITEDGESFCVRALTMAQAIKWCEEFYILELNSEKEIDNLSSEIDYYHNNVLQSCSLIGEIKN